MSMDNLPETKYENYLHRRGEQAELREEFDRRQRGGWSLWRMDPFDDGDALLQFKYPSDWSPRTRDRPKRRVNTRVQTKGEVHLWASCVQNRGVPTVAMPV